MAATAAAAAAGNAVKRARAKNYPFGCRGVFDLLRVLPNSGVGAKVARSNWTEKSYWEVTRVKIAPDGSHGQVWGTLYFDGEVNSSRRMRGEDTAIPGPLKRKWRVREGTLPESGWVSEDWSDIKRRLRELEAEQNAAGEVGAEEEGAAGKEEQS